jgi:prepilin peptidase CpaA
MLPLTTYILLSALTVAVYIDQAQHRIPNRLTLGLLVSGIAAQGLLHGVSGLGDSLLGMLLGFGIFLIGYLKRGMAAGDVKLMAAVGAWLGWELALVAACGALIVGGGFALLLLTYRYYREATPGVDAVLSARFPFASSIAIGTAAAILLQELSWTL